METRPTPAAEKPVDVDVLVTPGWLEAHLSDPDLRVIEIDMSPVAFEAGHIDGAVLWNVYRDLKDPAYRPVTRAAVGALLARSGGPSSPSWAAPHARICRLELDSEQFGERTRCRAPKPPGTIMPSYWSSVFTSSLPSWMSLAFIQSISGITSK